MNPIAALQVIFWAILAVSFAVSIILVIRNNKFMVEPGKRERLVLQNVFTGAMDVLGPGTYYRLPWWKELERVHINREPVSVNDDEVESADQIRFLFKFRYDIVVGRPYYEDGPLKGRLEFPNDIDNENHVDPKVIKETVIRVDFKNRQARVAGVVRGAVERVVGGIKAQALMRPDQLNPPLVIEIPEERGGLKGEPAPTKEKLLELLALKINEEANLGLTFVGINVVNFTITDLTPKDPKMKEAWEREVRQSELLRAAKDARKQSIDADPENPLSFREAVALGDPETAKAEALRSAGQSIRDGIRNFGKGNSPSKTP